jgi:CBS domain-containing protein
MTSPGDRSRHVAGDHLPPLVVHAMAPGVVQIPGDVSVRDAAHLMRKEHVPCLLVKDSDAAIGILAHADIVYKVTALGLLASEVEARAIMSRPVHTIEFDQPTEHAITMMASKGIPLLIVTRQKRPIGILTARDLIFSPKRPVSRISVSFRVQEGKTQGAIQVATLLQLSHLGGFIQTRAPLPPSTRLSLNFYLPGSDRPIAAHATVLSTREETRKSRGDQASPPPGMEILFSRLSASDQSQIAAWVLRTLYKQSGEQ